MRFPEGPIAAVTHPDPYPYYAELAASAPLARDPSLGPSTWLAASAEAASAVLASELCAVRPRAEPVPAMLVGSTAGDVFARLVRMSDGERHRARRRVLTGAVETMTAARVREASVGQARALAEGVELDGVTSFVFALPARAMGAVLGVPEADLARVARLVDDLAAGLAPGATADGVARGIAAADELVPQFRALVASHTGPLGHMARDDHVRGVAADVVVANAIGLLTQAHEATAGLIGNTLVALGRDTALCARAADADALAGIVADVARRDPPVQNTRRFVVDSGVIAGRAMREGDVVLVVLAAAKLAFGAGAHVCPGEAFALVIAEAGVRQLLASGIEPARLVPSLTYRPSANVRAPRFDRADRATARAS